MSEREACFISQCNCCSEYDNCKRKICDICYECEGIIFTIGEIDFCQSCFADIQSNMMNGISKVNQGQISLTTEETNEKIKITRKTITEEKREFILNRDNRECVYCGATELLQIDHIIPFSKGGTTEDSNLQTLCKKCNLKKRDIREAIQKRA